MPFILGDCGLAGEFRSAASAFGQIVEIVVLDGIWCRAKGSRSALRAVIWRDQCRLPGLLPLGVKAISVVHQRIDLGNCQHLSPGCIIPDSDTNNVAVEMGRRRLAFDRACNSIVHLFTPGET
jgi:hypothetical protein